MLFQSKFLMSPTSAAPIVYRSKSTGTGTTLTKPSGIAAGDIVLCLIQQSNSTDAVTSAGGTWSGTNFGGDATTFNPVNYWYWRVLTTADLSGSWTKPNANAWICVAYIGNGATTATSRENSGNVTGNVSLTGFTPTSLSRGVISLAEAPSVAPTAPTGFATRDQGSYGSPALAYSFADWTNYRGGGATWTASGSNCRANLIEIT